MGFLQNLKPRLSLIADVLIIALISCIPLLWIPQGKILTGHDSGYPINVIEAYKNRFFTWNTQDSLGLDNTTSISVIPILSLQAAASALGLSIPNTERVTFIFWFFAIQISMYVLAYSLREKIHYRWFPLLSALLYAFNFYLLALWRYGAGTTFSAYSLLPIAMLFTLKVIQKEIPPLRGATYLSFAILFFNGGGGLSLPLFGGLFVSLIWTILYFLIITPKNDFIGIRNRVSVFIGSVAVISIVLNSYWLFPFLYYVITNYSTELAAKGGKAVVVTWTDSVSSFTSISNLFRLQGFPDWYNNPYHPYANAFITRIPLILISLLFAPFAYLSLLLAKEGAVRRIITLFAGLSLIGILFSAGTHAPTGWIYRLMMLYVPGFVIFRSAQYKFVPALLLSFAILISFTLNYLLFEPKFLKNFFRRAAGFVRILLLILIFVVTLGYHYPYFQQNFFLYSKTLSTLISVPQYVHSFDGWSKNNFDNEGRTLILPKFNSSWKSGLYDWGYFSLYSPFNLITPRPFIQYSYFLNESQLSLFTRMTDELLKGSQLGDRLLSFFQIRHILLAKDIVSGDQDMPGEPWSKYQNALNRFPLVWHEGKWEVHAVPAYNREKIYALSGITRFSGRGEDSIGVFLAGSDEFILPNILGKNAKNPNLPNKMYQSAVYGIECITCKLYQQNHDIVPQYTSILPGSTFYSIKRLREGKPSQSKLSQNQYQDMILGLTLKRVSEVLSMISHQFDESRILTTVSEGAGLWEKLESSFPNDLTINSNVEFANRINDYASSERYHLLRAISDYPGYKQSLQPLLDRLDRIHFRLQEIRKYSKKTLTYKSNIDSDNASMYIDASALPQDSYGEPIYPSTIQVGGRQLPISKSASNGTINLGNFDIRDNDIISLTFPERDSIIGKSDVRMISIDNRMQQCEVAEVQGYDWRRKYRITMINATTLPSSFQLFLRKKKSYVPLFSLSDTVVKHDFAFNFDRTISGEQYLYLTGSDGDTAAYLYACMDRSDMMPNLRSILYAEEIAFPVLYIKSGDIQKPERLKVSYRQINQTKYEIDLTDIEYPVVLVFNENYNMLWRLSEHDATRSVADVLGTWKVPVYSEESHMQVNGYANAWYIKSKPQGGRLILEFYPQFLFYKGIIFSLSGMLLVLILMKLKKL